MNKTERGILRRMHCLLTAVPLPAGLRPGGSSQSASIEGCIGYSHDMVQMQPALDDAWEHFNYKEYEECQRKLAAIEAWVEMRRSEQYWQIVKNNKTIADFEREIEQKEA
jgi:hypothetical protein